MRNIPALVFEKEIFDFNPNVEPKDGDSENDQYLNFFRNNTNGVVSDHAIVTHYYPAIDDYWSKNTKSYNVPMKIEIRLFENKTKLVEIAKLTVNVASFKNEAENTEVFDVSACVENELDYNWFMVKFDDTADNTRKYKKYSAQIENNFRTIMDISPLR